MAQAANIHSVLGTAANVGGLNQIRDPGTGNTFDLIGKSDAWVSVGAGTYTLPDNMGLGTTLNVYATGTVVLQSVAAVTVVTLASGETAKCIATSATTWVAGVAQAGVATPAELYASAITSQGFIPIPLTALREASGMDVGAIAANGGVLASDTTPILEAINGDTDGCQRLNWASSNNDDVIFSIPLPPDLDTAGNMSVHLRAAMGGATDSNTPGLVSYFNEGDTAVADTFGEATTTTAPYDEISATIAAADVPTGAQTLTCQITPSAHTNDAFYVSAVWVEYTRKLLTS